MAGSHNQTISFKIVLLGEGCVGKTSLVLRYVEDKFNDKHYTTLQVCNSELCLNHDVSDLKLIKCYDI